MACAGCGAGLPSGARFCPQCGRAVLAARPRDPGEPLLAPAAREGERKQVTVLFADLKGSLELLAGRDPEDARRLLDPVLERMIEAVRRYEGTVNQVLGDGIMALFGAPLAQEDHAVRACYAALAMQAAVAAYAREVQRTEGVPIQIRVGLNSGEVVVRAIDSDLHLDYSAVGQATHLAARMEQMALPGSILATVHTARLAEGYVETRPLGPARVRGLADSIEVHEITGPGPIRSRLDAARARGLARFVGREIEQAALEAALGRAAGGAGQAVVVVGEAGVGKSRLLHEVTRAAERQGWTVLEAAAVPYGRGAGALPVVQLLRRYFGIGERDAVPAVREKAAGRLLMLDERLKDVLAPVLALLDALPEDWAFRALDPEERQRQIQEAVARIVACESRRAPLLLVVEDLHWADDGTLAVLQALAARLGGTRVVLAVSTRPEAGPRLGREADVEVRLEPLGPAPAGALLDALLGDDRGLQALKGLLVERAAGNPLFLEESVRALVETGALAGARGAYRLVRMPDHLEIPATVQAVLAARIDRLPAEDKRLLQTAAVIGVDVPLALLRAVAGLGDAAVRAALGRLQAAELLDEACLFPDLEYRFRHALTHEVAYRSLLQERRRALHAAVVEAIQSLDTQAAGRQIERLAHHAFQGELWEEAVAYLRRAGARAAARSAHAEAVERFEQALAALARLPRRRDLQQEALAIRLDLRRALLPLGRPDRILDHLAQAAALAEELEDRRELARISALRANHFWWVGDPEPAIAAALRALGLASELGDLTLETTARFYLGQARHALGDYREATACFRAVVDVAEREVGVGRLRGLAPLFFGAWLVRCLLEVGAVAEAREQVERAARLAATSDAPHAAIAAGHARGLLGVHGYEPDAAIEALERARALAEQVRLPVLAITTDTLLGRSVALAGTPGRAVPLLADAVARAEALGMGVDQALRRAWLAEALAAAGRVPEAEAEATAALAAAQRHHERGNEVYALVARAAAARGGGASRDALATVSEARCRAEALGMRLLAERCGTLAASLANGAALG
jgi:class 3 adenylate cyclase/tetratricopeptide (TPR) repeat protein